MIGLSDGDRISMIRSAVLSKYACDRQTELAWHRDYALKHYMLSRVKIGSEIRGPSPAKKMGHKNIKMWAKFRTTSQLDRTHNPNYTLFYAI